jgi:hypothetical protein
MKPFFIFLMCAAFATATNAQNQPKTTKTPCEKANTQLAQARKEIDKKNYKAAITKIVNARINCPAKAADADNILLKLIENRNENGAQDTQNTAANDKNDKNDKNDANERAAKIDKAVVLAQNTARIAALETEINTAKTERDAALAVRKSQAQALREADSLRTMAQQNLRIKDSILTKIRAQLADAQQIKQKFQSGIMTKALRQWETKKGIGSAKNSIENIDTLDLSYNMLAVLPEDVLRCKNLRSLNLIGNKDLSLPATLAALQALPLLTDIRISAIRIDSILPVHYEKITHLDMSGNEITSIMADIANFANLHQLDLSNNKLTTLPAEIGELKRLAVLNINDNRISRLPIELGNMPMLRLLNLSYNKLADFPDALGKLPQLTNLDLSHNKFVAINGNIATAVRLTDLNLSNNLLESLPMEIAKAPMLRNLVLFQNKLTELPKEMAKAKQLQTIDLRKNMLSVFPDVLLNIKTLKTVKLAVTELKSTEMARVQAKISKKKITIEE